MTPGTLFYLSMGGLLVATAAATAAKVLREFSRRKLEAYCRRRRRRELFSWILDHHDHLALTAESLQVVGTALTILAGSLWLFAVNRLHGPPTWLELLAGVGVGSLLLLAATIWIPVAVVRLWSAPFLYHTWRILWFVDRLLWPLTVGVSVVDSLLRRLSGQEEEKTDEEEAFEDEIRTIVTEGQHEGLMEADAREMIEGVIDLGDADVADIMTPRSEVDAIDTNMDWTNVLKFVIEAGRTRIPVYEKNLDDVVGVLFVKDLLPELAKPSSEPRHSLRQLLRTSWSVPKTMPVDDLLQEFLHTRSHLAIVLDEYDAMAGVVTIEDVLEEIVGEIEDESDELSEDGIVQIDKTTTEVLGKTHLGKLNERLGLGMAEPDEFDTIGGLVVNTLGHIPRVGEVVVVDDIRLTVLEATRRHVERLRLEIIDTNQRETA